MVLGVDSQELAEFCPQLFRTLDGLGLLPRQLSWKRDASGRPQRVAPAEFEKHARLLLGSIQRYNDVEAGFKEWESRVLRDVGSPSVREARFPDLNLLSRWMADRKEVFAKKSNMQHLRTSLYARVFAYLYPRRALANAYCAKHKGNAEAISAEFMDKALPQSIEAEVRKLKEAYEHEWTAIITDARASLIANAAYYRKILGGEAAVATPGFETNGMDDQEVGLGEEE